MNPLLRGKTYDICTVRVPLGHATYSRPCIVVDKESDAVKVFVFALSTKNYSERGQSFRIDSMHSGFPGTGLQATSYTVHPIQEIYPDELGPKIGVLTGALAAEFTDWLE